MTESYVSHLAERGMSGNDLQKAAGDMLAAYNKVSNLERMIRNCRSCALHANCTHSPLPGTGNMHPEVVIVSDTPTKEEDNLAHPSVAEYALFLTVMFQRIGLTMEDLYWTHAVKCPVEKMKLIHINDCHFHLANQLGYLRPTVIVALGTTAISSLAAEQIKIDDAIGGDFYFTVGDQEIPVIPVRHPNTFLHAEDAVFKKCVNETWKAIKSISDLMNEDEDEEDTSEEDDSDFEDDDDGEDWEA